MQVILAFTSGQGEKPISLCSLHVSRIDRIVL